MADEKGGSDLDVFEGLAKKAARPTSPGLAPPSTQPRPRALGGLSTPLPPPPGGGAVGTLPPPTMPKSSPLVPPPPSGARPLPPPAAPPPAVAAAAAGTLPPMATPPPGGVMRSTPLPALPALTPPPGGVTSAAVGTSALPAPLPPPMAPPSPGGTPAAAPAPSEKKKAKGDMDWDDEDESTHIFPGAQGEGSASTGPRPAAGAPLGGAASALLAGSGGLAAAPASTVRAPSAALPMPTPPPGGGYAPASSAAPTTEPSPARPARHEEATVVRERPTSGGGKAGVILAAISLVVVLGLAAFLLIPKKGDIRIDIKSRTGAPIAKAEIYLDGNKKCDTSPCVVNDLEAGPKTIKIIAPDFAPLEQTETIESGKSKVVLITVDLTGSAPAAVQQPPQGPAVTGLKIGGTQPNVKVFVDGAEKGTLPLDLKDIAPGSHKIRLEGGDRYEKIEQTVDVTQGQVKDLGTMKLKVLKGQVTLELVTQGANVSLVRTDEKKPEKKLPATIWKSPPVKFDINTVERWKIVATKKGFDDFTQEISFEDGEADKTIRIELNEVGKTPAVAIGSIGGDAPATGGGTTAPATGGGTTPATGGGTTTPPAGGDKAPPAATGNGTLNINSIPVSKVVLDGRPLGSTPKVGVSVPAGSHNVTFIHPELGKKSVTVVVKPGETKTAAVKFK